MNHELSRREFLRTLTVFGAAVLLPNEASAQGAYLAVGKVTDFHSDVFTRVSLPDGNVIYVRRVGGKFHALSAKCTHKGCIVNWKAAQKEFVCPCHGGKFDATGKNIDGPPPSPLASLPVEVARGRVWVWG